MRREPTMSHLLFQPIALCGINVNHRSFVYNTKLLKFTLDNSWFINDVNLCLCLN